MVDDWNALYWPTKYFEWLSATKQRNVLPLEIRLAVAVSAPPPPPPPHTQPPILVSLRHLTSSVSTKDTPGARSAHDVALHFSICC